MTNDRVRTANKLSGRDAALRAVLIVVFAGNIVLCHFVGVHFLLDVGVGVFYSAHDSRLEGLPFFEQFVGALRIHILDNRNVIGVGISGAASAFELASRLSGTFHRRWPANADFAHAVEVDNQ